MKVLSKVKTDTARIKVVESKVFRKFYKLSFTENLNGCYYLRLCENGKIDKYCRACVGKRLPSKYIKTEQSTD